MAVDGIVDTRESEIQAQMMLDTAPLAASVWGEDGHMMNCNMEAVRMFGLKEKADYVKHFYDLNPEFQPDGEKTQDKAARMIKAAFDEGYQRFEWLYLTGSGQPLPVETTLVRVPWTDGTRRLMAYSRDLREYKALMAEIQAQIDRAEAAAKAKSEFLARMSHEIRTPMNAIIGMSELIRMDNMDEIQRDYFDDIRRMSKSLLTLINDILDFSKIEAGKLDIAPVHYNMYMLFDQVCSMNRFLATGKSLNLHSFRDPSVPELLFGDEGRIRQIFTNILSNAIKYTREGYVRFTMTTEERDGKRFIVATAEDTGVGIKEEDLPKLFGTFQQLDSGTNRGVTGTGLGLAITRNLLELMGGSIEVRSVYGKGSCFTARIPLVPGDPAKIEAVCSRSVTVRENACALVVDDISTNLKVASRFVAKYGVEVDTALSGEEAVAKAAQKGYDIIFMDHMMPGMDGVEATAKIRALPGCGTTPIIALTANAVTGMREFFLGNGFDDYLAKPIELAKLNMIMERWCAPRPAAREKAPNVQAGKPMFLQEKMPEDRAGMHIPGVDTAAGIEMLGGSEEVYRDVLGAFCEDVTERLPTLSHVPDSKGLPLFITMAHAIKGAAANISAKAMSQKAARLEQAGKNGDIAAIRLEIPDFIADLTTLSGDIERALGI
ncbi:MAG: response regulator [Spirochaetaceae bacterium]|jgi:signal transduction histidine kinase/CheY-like chemotaxis protein|nr:response regulator [Spirochaetaceae bacterium]